jgi:hypothetical protein
MAYSIAVLSVVAVISIALTVRGWKSRVPAFDILTYIYGVRNFLETGALPQHGDTGSYGSYKPPGTAWLMLPSTLLFSDPRLSPYVGTVLLHISTLLGIYLLARRYFGLWAALLAVLLHGMSAHALFQAGSLWPNGRPEFYIWVVYFTSQWAVRRDARYLAAALAVWGLGMYVDMAIAPVLFILPVVGLYYQLPVRLKPLLVVGIMVLIAWSPYLRLQTSRGFADIRSQLLQQNILPTNYRVTWCDGSRTLQEWQDISSAAETSLPQTAPSPDRNFALVNRLMNAASIAKEQLLYNYQPVAPIPGASYLLLLLTLCSLLALSTPRASADRAKPIAPRRFWHNRPRLIAVSMILCGVLITGFVLTVWLFGVEGALQGSTSRLLNRLQKMLVLSGIALLAGSWLTAAASRVLSWLGVQMQTAESAERTRSLILSLLVPWFVLLLFAEPGKPERFMWLWPLQSMFLAAFFTNVLPRFRIPRTAICMGLVVVIIAVIGNPSLQSKVAAWARDGWAGRDAAEIQVVDTIARHIKAEGKDQAAIGYQTFIYLFMASYNITNPIYKVGAEFDLLFRYRHGISNINQCPEGTSPNDEYRIVQTRPKQPEWHPRSYFDAAMDSNFRLVRQFDLYQVFKRD